jgi:restriction system protein
MSQPSLPAYNELHWPTVVAVRQLGGSASIGEIVETVIEHEGLTEEQQSILHGDGPQTEIEYRLAWARTYLKGMGLLVNSPRGVWSLTEQGRPVQQDEIAALHRQYVAQYREERRRKRQVDGSPADNTGGGADEEASWEDQLLDALMAMKPDGFERLAQRLLREAGFISATVTGRTGDGGIDGLGVYRMSLVSFPVFINARDTKEASDRPRSVTSEEPWRVAETRGSSSPQGRSPVKPKPRPPAMGRLQSTSSMAFGSASFLRSTTSG